MSLTAACVTHCARAGTNARSRMSLTAACITQHVREGPMRSCACGPLSACLSSLGAPSDGGRVAELGDGGGSQTLLDLARLASAAEAAADERVSWEMATAGDRAAWIAAGRHVTFSPATLHTTNICDNDQHRDEWCPRNLL